MPAKSTVTRLKHVTIGRRATVKRQISLSHKPGTVETVRSPRKMLLEQGRTCENNATSMEDVHRATKECHNFTVKHALGLEANRGTVV